MLVAFIFPSVTHSATLATALETRETGATARETTARTADYAPDHRKHNQRDNDDYDYCRIPISKISKDLESA